jgi:hypothetical protein
MKSVSQKILKRGQALRYNSGQAALVAVLFFLFVSLVVLGAFAALGVSQLQGANNLLASRKSYASAASGVDDAIYRVAKQINFENSREGSTKILTLNPALLNGTNATKTAIDNPLPSQYNISSTAAITSHFRAIAAQFSVRPTNAPGFPSAMMAGFLGIKLSGNTCVLHVNEEDTADCNNKKQGDGTDHGSVLTNGNIIAGANAGDFITGSAIIARTTANLESFAQVNWPSTRTTIKLGDAADNSHDYAAQSFIPSKTAPIARVDLYLSYSGANPQPPITIKIHPNNPSGGVDKPLTTETLAQKTLNQNDYSDWSVDPPVERHVELSISGSGEDYRTAYENEMYWVVLYANNTSLGAAKYYKLGVASTDGTTANDDAGYTTGQNTCYKKLWCNPQYATTTPYVNQNSNEEDATFKYSANSSTWNMPTPSFDMAFKVYVGGGTTAPNGTRITRADGIETGHGTNAEVIRDSTIGTFGGNARYKYIDGTVTAGNNPAITCNDSSIGPPCYSNTAYGEDVESQIPEPRGLITVYGCDGWWQNCIVTYMKDQASAGWFINGSLNINNTGVTKVGSGKIKGDLTIQQSGGFLEITKNNGDPDPVIWVTGSGTLRNGQCTVKVTYPAKTATIIFDGKVSLANNCRVVGYDKNGNVDPNVFVYIYSLFYDIADSTEPANTISLNNNINGIKEELNGLYFAPFGEIRLDGSPRTVALSATRINAFNNTKVIYNSGVALPISQGGATALIPIFSSFHESE